MISRRSVVAAANALAIVPRHVLGGAGFVAPSDKLNIGAIGVGGVARSYLAGCETENIVALCDVDDALAANMYRKYSGAKTYRDYRVLLDKEKEIDAVIVATPDHSHALIAAAAMRAGKHCYCAKPLTRTIPEARLLAGLAREKKLATQMSVQSCASEPACETEEWIKAGAIGKISEVHVWSDRPIWPQGGPRPTEALNPPSTLDWELWLGPAPARPYHPAYHPFSWRGWYDFGTGALGDMACHAFHVVFRALNLGAPLGVSATTSESVQSAIEEKAGAYVLRTKHAQHPESFPASSIVTWDFPDGLRLHWYDGGLKPPRPRDLPPGENLAAHGVLYVGEKGVLLSGFTGGSRLLPEERHKAFSPPPQTVPRTIGHYAEWIAACKGGKPANCHFEFGARLTEVALLGTIAQRTRRYLAWEASAGRITNHAEANALLNPPSRSGWAL